MSADGWAIVEDGKIDVRTVSPTRRAAIVNWLVTDRNMMIFSSMTDEDIERMWHRMCGHSICTTVTIDVTSR